MQQVVDLQTQLEKLNPSFQTSKKMSDKYVWMDTQQLVNELLSLKSKTTGEDIFVLREIRIGTSRKSSTVGRGKHTVKIRTAIPLESSKGEILYPEIIILNSYDGSSPLKVEVGLFRQVCSNGLCVKINDLGEIKLRHLGTPWESAQEIIKGFISQVPKVANVQKQLAATNLDGVQIIEFAKKAAKIRWEKVADDAQFEELLEAVRPEDEGSDLWTVFNRVQEKLQNGGVKLKGMKRTARAIKNVTEDLRVNQELFTLAMEFVAN